MAKLIYIDTNVYLDYLENRIDKMRPLGEFAYNIFKRTFECEFIIITSELVFRELDRKASPFSVRHLFDKVRSFGKLQISTIDGNLIKEAKNISQELQVHESDVTHALLSHKAKAEFLVTRNLKDFEPLSDIVKPVLPENL